MEKSRSGFYNRPTTGDFKFDSGLRRLLANPQVLVIAVIAFTVFTASGFTLTNVALPGVAYSSVVSGDFNNDGKPDVLLTGLDGSFTGICQIWQNKSGSSFTNINAGFTGISSSAVARGDFNNDGRYDLLLTGFVGLDVNNFPIYISQVWRNLGNGSFTNIQAGLPGVDTSGVAAGDFDNDGSLDILLTGYSSTGAVAQVWRNLGNNTFTNIPVSLPGVLYSSVALGDYDNDGRLDILLAGTPDGFGSTALTQLWRNLGNGSFSNNISANLPGVTQGAVAWGDFDQDGRLDMLVSGFTTNGAVCQVRRNLGNGTFTNMNLGLPGIYQSAVAVADFDNDGRLDIALSGQNNQSAPISQVWRNTGNWVFTNFNASLTGVRYSSISWTDFDNDGKLDLLLAGLDTNSVPVTKVYRNVITTTNASPQRISNLKTLGNGSRQLSFDGPIGFGYTVWTSTNLVQWTSLGAPNDGNPATFQFSDGQATNARSKFYRVTRP